MSIDQGIQIILNRMDSNPEEFMDENGKWDWIIDPVVDRIQDGDHNGAPFLTTQEASAIYEKYQTIRRAAFTKRVLSTLLDEGEDEDGQYSRQEKKYFYGGSVKTIMLNEMTKNLNVIMQDEYAKMAGKWEDSK